MNTTTLSHGAARRTRGSYGFRAVAQMEWQKWWISAQFISSSQATPNF